MALFQAFVHKSHLAALDETAIDKAYKKHQKYFGNAQKLELSQKNS